MGKLIQVQEKNIKGFNLIELLVVIAIISVISAAAYPNFSSWKKAREVRGAAIEIKSLFTNINSQVQRGLYGFVQVEVTATEDGEVVVISKGMKLSNLAQKINYSEDAWNVDQTSRCALVQDWDDKGMDEGIKSNKLEVSSLQFDDIAVNFEDKSGTVCFSKDGSWYSTAEEFESSGAFYICEVKEIKCDVKEDGDPNDLNQDNLFALNWSRFGNITLEKWSKSKSEWILQ
ncbi:prepilin-type N-terminal cleavage/methylation domain-containing protein [Pelagibacteraceae bacterium]|jgi:prepilin-type N-terminal cleavage/methylation domain-containing protein|uniref:pilus assembly FimT family protein n=1 Tax=Pelagibacter sp. (strain IMCC9063) TaxID=1002672 RepID=UPI000204661A|nr:prepilin-type N-terminal cleavage/methylation domain-containing protein [Candidatus Pelagibacter sp. IMCC9063]AEA80711.1 putative pilin protein PilU [Candidatus Pelagibacter sp. IMCC9063]MDB4022504.1 prepilin-type N-terminal cleavage/methylation domain-containing protein [Pelagibacteraceae bacterium]MDC0425253.1 prepilin-type N-terminal cleavage/methylation domain-containing protein [Pelagibacteraceae bacterium]